MTFPRRLISDIPSNGDGTKNYVNKTGSKIKFESTISGLVVEFKGFITEMSDKFQSSWETEEVYGRMDPIGTFKNTKRTISLGWTIPAFSIGEAKSNFNAVRSLTSMLYPGYSAGKVTVGGKTFTTANSIAKPPLIRLTYANLISSVNVVAVDKDGNAVDDDDDKESQGLLGWVDGFDINPVLDLGFFIIKKKQFPKAYTMSCNFNVLHEHDLGWSSGKKWLGKNVDKFPFGEE